MSPKIQDDVKEDKNTAHVNSLWVDCLGYYTSLMSNEVHQIVKSRTLDLLPLEVTQWIHCKVKYSAALS